jgi:hypothetical protein
MKKLLKHLKTVRTHFDVILDKQEENLYVNMEESKKASTDCQKVIKIYLSKNLSNNLGNYTTKRFNFHPLRL